MPTVQGILETALSVADLPKSAAFYRRLFAFPTLLESDRLVALNVANRNVLLLFQAGATDLPSPTPGGTIPGHAGTGKSHFAFSIATDELPHWRTHLTTLAIPLESTVTWDGGSQSLYLRDPDGHLVELMTPGFWRLGAL